MDSPKGTQVMIIDFYQGTETITIDFIPFTISVRGESGITTDGNQSHLSLAEVTRVKDQEIRKHKEEVARWSEQVSSLHAKLDHLIDLVSSQYQRNLKDEKENDCETIEFGAENCVVELQIHQKVVEEPPQKSEHKVFDEMIETTMIPVELLGCESMVKYVPTLLNLKVISQYPNLLATLVVDNNEFEKRLLDMVNCGGLCGILDRMISNLELIIQIFDPGIKLKEENGGGKRLCVALKMKRSGRQAAEKCYPYASKDNCFGWGVCVEVMYVLAGTSGISMLNYTKDGATTVAKTIEFSDYTKNVGASLVKQVAKATNEFSDYTKNVGASLVKQVAKETNIVAGDGTTCSCASVLARAICRGGCESIAVGANEMNLSRGINMAVEDAIGEPDVKLHLKRKALMISTLEEITHVATSITGERGIGVLLARAEEGIILGGSFSRLYATKILKDTETKNEDPRRGVKIIENALKAPTFTIGSNVGADAEIILGKLLENNDKKLGYDVAKVDSKWCEWQYRLQRIDMKAKKMEEFMAATEQLDSKFGVLVELEQSLKVMRAGVNCGKIKINKIYI